MNSDRNQIHDSEGPLDLLRRHRNDLRNRFAVARLAAFGSAARNTLGQESDVDLLVEFDGPTTFDRFMNLKFFLEDLLQRRVDLVTSKALRPQIKSRIEGDLIDVA